MREQRQLNRSDLNICMTVNDAKTGNTLGQLSEINICGFLLTNKESLPTGKNHAIQIVLPEAIDGKKDITCDAMSSRCIKSARSNYFEIGFEITAIHPKERYVLEKMILQYERRLKQATG